jgi:hypothetical protein
VNGYDRDLDRARQDRLSTGGGLVSIAYWIVRGVSALFGLVARSVGRRTPSE